MLKSMPWGPYFRRRTEDGRPGVRYALRRAFSRRAGSPQKGRSAAVAHAAERPANHPSCTRSPVAASGDVIGMLYQAQSSRRHATPPRRGTRSTSGSLHARAAWTSVSPALRPSVLTPIWTGSYLSAANAPHPIRSFLVPIHIPVAPRKPHPPVARLTAVLGSVGCQAAVLPFAPCGGPVPSLMSIPSSQRSPVLFSHHLYATTAISLRLQARFKGQGGEEHVVCQIGQHRHPSVCLRCQDSPRAISTAVSSRLRAFERRVQNASIAELVELEVYGAWYTGRGPRPGVVLWPWSVGPHVHLRLPRIAQVA